MADLSFKIVSSYHEEMVTKENIDNLDIVSLGNNDFHILENGKSHRIRIEQFQKDAKTYKVNINGNDYSIQLKDGYDLLIEKMGLNVLSDQKVGDVKAPIPGLVIDILAKPGEEISEGTPLLILEAMKMENVLKATGEGVIKNISVEKGSTVDKGQLLIEMEK